MLAYQLPWFPYFFIPAFAFFSKSKNPEKDEKRHLGNLQLIADVRSDVESREITRRFDLDLGCYLMVPYTYQAGQEGEFLARILCEKVPLDGKTGW